MKQLLILSGKGGTGKTTITSAFINLHDAKVYADCDVDAPNLHLIKGKESEPKKTDYYGLPKAEINKELCIECNKCKDSCKFNAISSEDGYEVDFYACEGCGVCEYVCPVDAINLKPNVAGELKLYKDNNKVFSTAQLKMGNGTSGLLVTKVKVQMKANAKDAELAIIDGSPGIGCPVIASLSGVDMVLVVTEPSLSGISDMDRIIETSRKFATKIIVCVNKYDTNIENFEKIKLYCSKNKINFVGEISYDLEAIKAVNSGLTIVDIDCKSGNEIKKVYQKTIKLLFEN